MNRSEMTEERREKMRLYFRQYREKNKEHIKLKAIVRAKENPKYKTEEQILKERAYQKEYRQKHKKT